MNRLIEKVTLAKLDGSYIKLLNHLERQTLGSFSNIGTGNAILNNLNYFSFTTLLTISFADITSQTLVAKRAVMFIGLAGHFYTVFTTSIIIGNINQQKYK